MRSPSAPDAPTLLRVATALVAALCAPSCTVLVDSTAKQCDRTSDCRARGAAFASTVCTEEKVCASLTSEDCLEVSGPAEDDDAIVIGNLAPIVGEYASIAVPIQNAAELALYEFNGTALGVPGGEGGRPRPLAMVRCNSFADADRAARHLVERLRVPVILGDIFSSLTLQVAKSITIPAGVLLLSPAASNPTITTLEDDGLVWRTAPSDAVQGVGIALLVPEVEEEVRAALGMDAEPIRLAMTVKGDAYGTGLRNTVLPKLVFNNKNATENGPLFLQIEYPDIKEQPDFDYGEVVTAVAQFRPHIVVMLGAPEIVTEIMAPLEAMWPAEAPRPRYVTAEGGRAPATLDLIGPDDDLRRRLRGTSPGRPTALLHAFELRYKARYLNQSPSIYGSNAYDAGYLVAYAMSAVSDRPLTGETIRDGFARLVSGETIPVGPERINDVLARLVVGGSFDFDGASGPLDFDLATGEAEADTDIWCVTRDIQQNPVFTSSGRYYSASSHELLGTFSCP